MIVAIPWRDRERNWRPR